MLESLFKMMNRGIVGKEDASKFDEPFSGVAANEHHSAYDADLTDSYYNIATDFYEYGWGQSFHFGYRQPHEGLIYSIINTEAFLATKLQVKDMDRVVDLGCGVGGPLRSIVRQTGANVTGVTINQHQVNRAKAITSELPDYVRRRAHYVQDDMLVLSKLESGVYDAAYYLESAIHVDNRTQTYAETYRLLKPGAKMVLLDYVILPAYNPKNPEHLEYMRMIQKGNAFGHFPTVPEFIK